MKRLFSLYIKIFSVFLCLILLLLVLTPAFVPKYVDGFATTSVMDGFYELDENSIDVLFLGSSQIMTAASPMQLYKETGITSYNMGTEQQNLVSSYYLLKEALRYQTPQVVVLETWFLFPYNTNSLLNSSEEFVRKPIDYMQWSSNKLEFIRTVCSLDSEHNFSGYVFPFLRFHSRWNDLTLEDFTYVFETKTNPARGFCITANTIPQGFQGLVLSDPNNCAEPLETMKQYFDNIVSLCKENNITLVLMKTPRGDGSFGENYHNCVQALAEENRLVFIDFNEKSLFDEINFDCSADCTDVSHVNYFGAEKITRYLSDYLASNFTLKDQRENPDYNNWNEDLTIYLEQIPDEKNELPVQD